MRVSRRAHDATGEAHNTADDKDWFMTGGVHNAADDESE